MTTENNAEHVEDDFYYDDASEPDEPVCPHCGGDGMDPMTDYLLPCEMCQGEQKP